MIASLIAVNMETMRMDGRGRITRDALYSLEDYAKIRPEFRARVMAHKKGRQIALGGHVRLLFEDRLTIWYQIQEMLRAERLFEEEDIQEELDAYNPLIPDGSNWKATMLLEYEDPEERQQATSTLLGIESQVWTQIGSGSKIYAIADEDLPRATPTRTSTVHFLRFELPLEDAMRARAMDPVSFGIGHPLYQTGPVLALPSLLQQLAKDLES